jgi:glycosyltransferase involved in cell wall biosynthesis
MMDDVVHTDRPHREHIAAVPDDAVRPFWSVMIPSYNCARYLRHTLASVLEQDPGPDQMQIEVVDDHSSLDDPSAVVEELGRGRVDFHRQPKNVGHVANFNTCLRRSRGHVVHLLHGDDLVRPGFYRTMERALSAHREAGAAFCRQQIIDEEGAPVAVSPLQQEQPGIIADWLRQIAEGQRLQTPSIVVRRAVYERLGGFDDRLSYCEDWEMWVRIAAHYPVWYEPKPLAVYRIHRSSNTGQLTRSGENIRDLRRAVDINRAYLAPEVADRISRRAHLNIALGAVRRARRILKAGDRGVARVQIREALRSSRSPLVFAQIAKVGLLWALRYAWSRPAPATTRSADRRS